MRFNASTTLQKKTQNGGSFHILVSVRKTTFLNVLRILTLKLQKDKKYAVSRMYLKNYVQLINGSAKSTSLFWYYLKQIKNVFIHAMVRIFSVGERWNVLFNTAIASLNRTSHLPSHENILTIALINIHYLYNIPQLEIPCNRVL